MSASVRLNVHKIQNARIRTVHTTVTVVVGEKPKKALGLNIHRLLKDSCVFNSENLTGRDREYTVLS